MKKFSEPEITVFNLVDVVVASTIIGCTADTCRDDQACYKVECPTVCAPVK